MHYLLIFLISQSYREYNLLLKRIPGFPDYEGFEISSDRKERRLQGE